MVQKSVRYIILACTVPPPVFGLTLVETDVNVSVQFIPTLLVTLELPFTKISPTCKVGDFPKVFEQKQLSIHPIVFMFIQNLKYDRRKCS